MLSRRIQNLETSQTMALNAKAKELQAKGEKIINLTAGELDFPTPENIKDAGKKAITENFTRYTSNEGIIELRNAICEKFKRDNNIIYTPDQVTIGNGAKQVLYNAVQALCEEGDEVIIPIPAWSTFVEQVKLSGATPILVTLRSPFKLKAEDIKNNISKKTKVIIINTPSNPTGAMIDKEELEKIAQLVVENNLWIIVDEIYEKITFGKEHISIASLNEEIKKRTIVINGMSKTYAMTGWRLGYAAGSKEVILAMTALTSQTTSNVCSVTQKAGLEALTGPQDSVNTMVNIIKERRDIIYKLLKEIEGIELAESEGSFYLFVQIDKLIGGKLQSSQQFCNELLENHKVAVVPGEAFCYKNSFRVSLTSPIEDLKEAVSKIKLLTQKYD